MHSEIRSWRCKEDGIFLYTLFYWRLDPRTRENSLLAVDWSPCQRPVRQIWCVWIICWGSHHVYFFHLRSCWKFKKGSQKVSCRENGCQASEPVRWLRNHMGTPTISPHCEVAAGGSSKSSCVYCGFQSPKRSVLIESLRNSLGERMSLLRGNPLSALHTDYIQMMLELSKEQGFEVTYFNIGKTTFLLVSMQQVQYTEFMSNSQNNFQPTAPPAGVITHYS